MSAMVLVIDDEKLIRETLAEYLEAEGFTVHTAGSGEAGLERIQEAFFDFAICDMNLPGMDGIEVLQRVLQISPETLFILVTAYATVETAVEAFQQGAQDYLMKPILLEEVHRKMKRLMQLRELRLENQWLRRELNRAIEAETVIGSSPAMQAIWSMAQKVASTRSTVLITGESGTGKEVMARMIHHHSGVPAEQGRLIAVNCASIPNDLLENQLFGHRRGAFSGAERDQTGVFLHAGKGTVFLDEVAELPPGIQAKLLRAIEQKEIHPVGANEPIQVEARIIAATNKDLLKEVAAGRFREDLYYRLNVVHLHLPTLWERREDLPHLVEVLLQRAAKNLGKQVSGVSHEAMQKLVSAPWKGNIRELDNALQRAVILSEGPLLQVGDFPPDLLVREDPFVIEDLNAALERFERIHIARILKQTPDKSEAAKRLGIGVSSLYRKIQQLGISLG